uniref:Uncharacterized protein n=1 Tax=Zea mays TaxID=4577 RepID=A0A804N2W6_MAIZE
MNEDFLIIILRDLLPRRPDLRLVLMSATINAELFSKYFGDAPVMHIPGFTFPVAELFLEDVLEKTRYRINSERDNFAGSSRRKRFSSVKSDPLSDVFEDIDITKEYGNYSSSTRQSLEAWSAAELDLSLREIWEGSTAAGCTSCTPSVEVKIVTRREFAVIRVKVWRLVGACGRAQELAGGRTLGNCWSEQSFRHGS